jgi:hypothetical protein
VAAILALGWLTASASMNLLARQAAHERGRVEARMREAIGVIARQMVIAPVEQELSEFARFREAFAQAAGTGAGQ